MLELSYVLLENLNYENFDNYDSNYLQTYFENMYIYTRVIKEKQIEKSDDTILLRFKRVSNYHNLNTKQSIISTLKNPIYGLDDDDIIKSINEKNDIEMVARQAKTVSQNILTSFGNRIKIKYIK